MTGQLRFLGGHKHAVRVDPFAIDESYQAELQDIR
jgi:hypothetical protein